jgi:hypothetical protein
MQEAVRETVEYRNESYVKRHDTKKVRCGFYSYSFLQKLCILLDETLAKLQMSEIPVV